jgi:HTH-type transcriptional regulator, sugar sensing transcriptional regulator
MDLSNLGELGLSQGEISVYNALLSTGLSNLQKIQEKTGIERRNIYDILSKLINKGLVSYTIEDNKRKYQCTSPNKLNEDITKKQAQLDEIKKQIPLMQQIYDNKSPDINAQVYRGVDAIKNLLEELLTHKASYWMGGNSFERYTAAPKGLQLWFEAWMKKRVEVEHVMYDLVSSGTSLKGLDKSHESKKYHYCELPKGMYTPMVIIIFGDKVAQVLWNDQPFAFVMESKKTQQTFMKYFKHFWKGKIN